MMSWRRKVRTVFWAGLFALILVFALGAQKTFAAEEEEYSLAKNAQAMTLNTNSTVVFEWDDVTESFNGSQYRKFTPAETGAYDIYMYNSYGAQNAQDLYINAFHNADDAYLYQNDIDCIGITYLEEDAAACKVYELEKGKTYYFRFSCFSPDQGYNRYSVKIKQHVHRWEGHSQKGSFKEDGYTSWYCSTCNTSRHEEYPSMAKVSLSKKTYVYNGKVHKPAITIKDESGHVIDAKNYKVTYANNKKVGKATVTIKGVGNYQGTKKLTFTINPKATKITKVTPLKKAFTVKWAKRTTQTTGYQIKYSTSKSFKKNTKTVLIKKAGKVSKKVTNLKAGKKYYVKVRTYKVVNGKKYYSAWSKVKSVTTKK